MKIQKFQYIENEKSFLDEIKTFFMVFEGLLYGEKQKFDKKQLTQALTYNHYYTDIHFIFTTFQFGKFQNS